MINQGNAPDQAPARQRSLVGNLLLEQVVFLALVLVIGGLALAEAGGLLGSFAHVIPVVA